jgi:hypothetical protein
MEPRYAPYPPVPHRAPQARQQPRMNKAQMQERVRLLKKRIIVGSILTFTALTSIITLRTYKIDLLASLTGGDQNSQQNQGGGFFQQGQNGGVNGGNGSGSVTGSGGS